MQMEAHIPLFKYLKGVSQANTSLTKKILTPALTNAAWSQSPAPSVEDDPTGRAAPGMKPPLPRQRPVLLGIATTFPNLWRAEMISLMMVSREQILALK